MIETYLKPNSNFTYIRIRDKLTDQHLYDHIKHFNRITADLVGTIELADCRGIDEFDQLTVVGVLKAANLELGQSRNTGSRVAILVDNELGFGLARIYATFAGEYKDDINIFYNIDEAYEWLNPSEGVSEIAEFVSAITNH